MSGGIIQLVAYGVQDLFLTQNPQITFFKIVYRRHTNFAIEPVKQEFNTIPDFGTKTTCVFSKQADLINQVYLVLKLPEINIPPPSNSNEPQVYFSWVNYIGYAIISSIRVEIGGFRIDEQYGEWMFIWHQLFIKRSNGIDAMIGQISDLIDYSVHKDQYTLYIPLQFWFCKYVGSSLPMVSLQYTDVRISLELADFSRCHKLSPTHSIIIENNVVNFNKYEYIEQIVDGQIASGYFINFDYINIV